MIPNQMPPLRTCITSLAVYADGFSALLTQRGYVPLLPLLEYPYPEVEAHMLPLFLAVGLTQEAYQCVSFKDLILFALQSPSAYWTDRAADWLEHGCPVDADVVAALATISAQATVAQQTRHRAARLVRQWMGRSET